MKITINNNEIIFQISLDKSEKIELVNFINSTSETTENSVEKLTDILSGNLQEKIELEENLSELNSDAAIIFKLMKAIVSRLNNHFD